MASHSYFDKFPLWAYKFNGTYKLVPNLYRKIIITDEVETNISMLEEYTIKDFDTARNLAFRLYGSAELFWVIYMVNDIYDEYEQWPLSQELLIQYCYRKYGEENLNALHHYESNLGETVDKEHPEYDRKFISNFEFEDRLNNEKRKIKLLKPSVLPKFLAQFKALLDE